MINLEIKVVAPNIEEIKNKALEIGASNKSILHQADIYFLTGIKRLKLREESLLLNSLDKTKRSEFELFFKDRSTCKKLKFKNYIVYYVRGNKKDSKFSNYHIVNVPNILLTLTKKVLTFVFGIKVVVNKERELFIYKNTRIHCDAVKNLGNYVELETVFSKTQNEEDLTQEHQFVIQLLGLNYLEKIPDSYSDLLIYKNLK